MCRAKQGRLPRGMRAIRTYTDPSGSGGSSVYPGPFRADGNKRGFWSLRFACSVSMTGAALARTQEPSMNVGDLCKTAVVTIGGIETGERGHTNDA